MDEIEAYQLFIAELEDKIISLEKQIEELQLALKQKNDEVHKPLYDIRRVRPVGSIKKVGDDWY